MLLTKLHIANYLLFVLLVHGEYLVFPGPVTASGALEGLLKPLIPAAQTGHMLTFGDI